MPMDGNIDYWLECISEAFEECNIKATTQQIKDVAEFVEGASENYSLATGIEASHVGGKSDAEIELEKLKKKIEGKRIWNVSTQPCRACVTTGSVKDLWGRVRECDCCGGAGRF